MERCWRGIHKVKKIVGSNFDIDGSHGRVCSARKRQQGGPRDHVKQKEKLVEVESRD